MKNLHFNRLEKKGRHIYIDDFSGARRFDDFESQGFIKCKLAQNHGYSIVIPEQIYVELGGELKWIQPLYFSGSVIGKHADIGICDLGVDVSFGQCLRLRFFPNDLISRLPDSGMLYKCRIKGPRYLYPYTTGSAKLVAGRPMLKLYHHTSRESKAGILSSGEYWSSSWNIQGTKRSTNISYLYLTPLPEIKTKEDLSQIAMSSQGKLGFRIDSNLDGLPDLILDVYRESTSNRTHTLSGWVDASLLSTQPCYRHSPPDGFGYHAIVSPYIQRIGVEPGTKILIDGGRLSPEAPKSINYAIVGDATRIDGLSAPFDEEKTPEVLKIEMISPPLEIVSFWMENANTDQFSGKTIDPVEFGA